MPAKGVFNNKEQLKTHYDAVIIGGGIQGAGCAQALAARGFSALLIEKSNVGTATSSRSSKLIHGGLRYLETYQFSLVKKSIAERTTLQNIAPSLVESRKFYLPVYKKQRLKRWQLAIGLFLYSA
ncbi:MAG: FAD-dependent oxidoreductase, partial [Pseudomonadales bacterium]